MTLACLASQSCTELGPAQPQLVQYEKWKPQLVYRNPNDVLLICDNIIFRNTKILKFVPQSVELNQATGTN